MLRRLIFLGLVSLGLKPVSASSEAAARLEIPLAAEPDRPVGFGYKICWFAVRTTDADAVAEAMELDRRRPANWRSGVAVAYGGTPGSERFVDVFVTPPVDGWTFAIGFDLPSPAQAGDKKRLRSGRHFRQLLSNLASRFAEVQFFGTHSVAQFDAWARAREGRIERIFSFVDGEVVASEGPLTSEEATLGFLDLGGRTPADATTYIFDRAEALEHDDCNAGEETSSGAAAQGRFRNEPIPGEDHTIALAGAWSIDPTTLDERSGPLGVGFVGRMRLR
jgi:hypothetical protein